MRSYLALPFLVMDKMFLITVLLLASSIWILTCSAAPSEPLEFIKSSDVRWDECGRGVNGNIIVHCIRIQTPIDYEDMSKGNFDLFVKKIPATNGGSDAPSLIWYPGGPGLPGATGEDSDIEAYFTLLNNFTQGKYDIIGFDPRGTGQTSLRIWCHNSIEEENEYVKNGYPDPPDFPMDFDDSDAHALDPFKSQLEEYWDIYAKIFRKCKDLTPHLAFVGSTSTAKDIAYLAGLFDGKDSLINYFGISYGSMVGSFVAQMYPSRVGHVVIDGIVDPAYLTNSPYKGIGHSLIDADAQYQFMLDTCVSAGPEACPYFEMDPNVTGDSVIKKIDEILKGRLNLEKSLTRGGTNRVVTLSNINLGTFVPPNYYQTAVNIYEKVIKPYDEAKANQSRGAEFTSTVQKNSRSGPKKQLFNSEYSTRVARDDNDPAPGYTNSTTGELIFTAFDSEIALKVIGCADGKPYTDEEVPSVEDMVDQFKEYREMSPRLAAGIINMGGVVCHILQEGGTFEGAPRYDGSFDSKNLKNKVLIGTNTFDPSTEYNGAKKVANRFGDNGRLFVVDGYGHTTTPNRDPIAPCVANTYQKFFSVQEYPVPGKECSFPEGTYEQYFIQGAAAAGKDA